MRLNDALGGFGRHNDKPCRLGGSGAAWYLGAKLYGLGSYDKGRVCQGFSSILMHLIRLRRAQSADAQFMLMLTTTVAVSAGRWHGGKACIRVCSDSHQLKRSEYAFGRSECASLSSFSTFERSTAHAQVAWGCDPLNPTMLATDATRSHRVGCGAAAARATPQMPINQAVRSLQIAKTLELDPTQSAAVASLWGAYEAQLSRVLEARVAIHRRISATMPNGYMGRDFAVKNFRVRALAPRRLQGPDSPSTGASHHAQRLHGPRLCHQEFQMRALISRRLHGPSCLQEYLGCVRLFNVRAFRPVVVCPA